MELDSSATVAGPTALPIAYRIEASCGSAAESVLMSYCRFSSDDWRSDVYVYHDVGGGWTTHVATHHPVFRTPLPAEVPFPNDASQDKQLMDWFHRTESVMAMFDEAEKVPLDLPHAGETFNDPTPAACADRLESLRELGYHVPQSAIDGLRAEDPGSDVPEV